jgi:hypothetical protein
MRPGAPRNGSALSRSSSVTHALLPSFTLSSYGLSILLIPQFAGLGYNPQQRLVSTQVFPELGGVNVDWDTHKRNR